MINVIYTQAYKYYIYRLDLAKIMPDITTSFFGKGSFVRLNLDISVDNLI